MSMRFLLQKIMDLKYYRIALLIICLSSLGLALLLTFQPYPFLWMTVPLASQSVQSGKQGAHIYVISTGIDIDTSSTKLFEDGRAMGPENALRIDIGRVGGGRYFFEKGRLFFSTSDNSDPRTNGRHYTLALPRTIPSMWLMLTWSGWVFFILFCLLWQWRKNVCRNILRINMSRFSIAIITIFVISFILHCVYLMSTSFYMTADTRSFVGLYLVKDHSFRNVLSIRGPGMALLIEPIMMLFGSLSTLPVKLFMHILGMGCVLLTYCLAWQLTKKTWFAFLCGLFAAVWREGYYFSNSLLSEIPSAFFILLSMNCMFEYYYSRRKRYLFAGLLSTSFAALIRTENTALLVVYIFLLGGIFLQDRKYPISSRVELYHILIALVLAVLPLIAWSAYNQQRLGSWSLSTYPYRVFYQGVINSGYEQNIPIADESSESVRLIQNGQKWYCAWRLTNGVKIENNDNCIFGRDSNWDNGALLFWLSVKDRYVWNADLDLKKVEFKPTFALMEKANKVMINATLDSIRDKPLTYIYLQIEKLKDSLPFSDEDLRTSPLPGEDAKLIMEKDRLVYYKDFYSQYLPDFDQESNNLFVIRLQRVINGWYNGILLTKIVDVRPITNWLGGRPLGIYSSLRWLALLGFIICLFRRPFILWFTFLAITFGKVIFPVILNGGAMGRHMSEVGFLYLVLMVAVPWILIESAIKLWMLIQSKSFFARKRVGHPLL